MADPNHIRIVRQALEGSDVEQDVKMMFGELMLFHVLMQNHALDYIHPDSFIPLMERNKARIDSIREV